ncbi:MAG: ribosome silencing factor [Bacteroidales bacterium]|nr:ribosome silencing factor [Bacteroidales bacterium]
MSRKKIHDDSAVMVENAIAAMQDQKAEDIVVLDFRKIKNALCDYFVICHANNKTQVQAIVNTLEFKMRKDANSHAWSVEGEANAEWILMDYGSVIIHVFEESIRRFYQIENLWGDAEVSRY